MKAKIHNSQLSNSGMNTARLNCVALASFSPDSSKKNITSNFLDAFGRVIKTKDNLIFKAKNNGIRK